MASAKFLEEALSTDIDESAVSALVGSLENQLVTSTPPPAVQINTTGVNHVNSAISNGGTITTEKHGPIPNGDTLNTVTTQDNKIIIPANIIAAATQPTPTANFIPQQNAPQTVEPKPNEPNVKIVYSQPTAMTTTGTIISNRVTFPTQSLPNGTIGLSPITPQTVLQTQTSSVQTIPSKQPTLVIKTSAAPGSAPGIVTVPMNVTAALPQVNNVGSPTTQPPNVISNLQVVNVRPGVPTQPQKGQPARVVLSAPQIVGTRPGTPIIHHSQALLNNNYLPNKSYLDQKQLTLQSLHGLQPGQQGHLLLRTENGQYQLLKVGPAPAGTQIASNTPGAAQPVTFRMQTVAAATTTAVTSQVAVGASTQTATPPTATIVTTSTPAQQKSNDNTKEKCRKFLANLLELSSREPKPVERSVRTLIQELIDMRVEPEDFCDRLERLLNASPQPCLIGFLKKSLPLLRHSLATKEVTIDGIRPPPPNVVFSIASATPTVQAQVRPGLATSQVRLVTPGTAVVRPGQVIQQRLVTPLRGAVQQTTRMVTTIRQPNSTTPVIVSSSQPPALHPVNPNAQFRPGVNIVRQPVQLRTVTPGQIRSPNIIRTTTPLQMKSPLTNAKLQGVKPAVPSSFNKPSTSKEKEKKSFSSVYTGDDDINDVAAMGGVNLAEETQRILGSTEFVGTQIRSCKEEYFLNMNALQTRIRQTAARHGLDEPSSEIAAVISHACQERLKNLVEKLAIITEHRLEMVKSDSRYEPTNDVKGQLKFLEDLDRAERKRHEEMEREMLLRAAKSRSKTEDPEQAKLKAKAKELQRVEMEELRQREANATALQAIGPRKKPKLDGDSILGGAQTNPALNSGARGQLPLRQRMKKVTLRDIQFMFESEKDLCRSTLLYKSYLK